MNDFFVGIMISITALYAQQYNLCVAVPTQPRAATYTKGDELIYFCNKFRVGVGFGIFAMILFLWAWCKSNGYHLILLLGQDIAEIRRPYDRTDDDRRRSSTPKPEASKELSPAEVASSKA
jgi:hypothetical protein